MGKLEKSVVLGVLFLISVIMVVSLSSGKVDEAPPLRDSLESRVAQAPADRSPETSTPLQRREPARFAETPAAPNTELSSSRVLPVEQMEVRLTEKAPLAEAERGQSQSNVGLLNSSVGEPQTPVQRNANGLRIQAGWDLTSVASLERSPNPSFLIHVCSSGETYEGLAKELYGDASKAGLLRRNNEGLKRLTAGLEILVPVTDDRVLDAGDYIVKEGESLWVISKQFYGQGARWADIFEANRDKLSSPESVREGMTLRIP